MHSEVLSRSSMHLTKQLNVLLADSIHISRRILDYIHRAKRALGRHNSQAILPQFIRPYSSLLRDFICPPARGFETKCNWRLPLKLSQTNKFLTNLPHPASLLWIAGLLWQLVFKWSRGLIPAPVNTRFCQAWITHNLVSKSQCKSIRKKYFSTHST